MRTKAEILKELSDREAEAPNWSFATLSQERIKIEVLIDIRDILDRKIPDPKSFLDQIINKD